MTTALELDERYGRTRDKRTPWIVGSAIALIVVLIFSWMTVSQSMNSVDADDLGYEVVDAHTVTVRFQIAGKQGVAVTCALEALDEEFGIVGWKIVEIPPGEGHIQQLSATIATVAEATTGLVNTCWVA
ncbi:transcriptional regulator [Microbacterium sp. CH12i]|uniref:DUF4307 domain-containing protein n=1 Tax=Microbacterium sp. CH12i TaxID=1479651 RepID=UPI000461DEC0|nr:DUF4307 domain-containing protein [Microbacterium sp. CH12i]KDA06507.1 transcriptional regulator [Microbacterium sp. CH12i]